MAVHLERRHSGVTDPTNLEGSQNNTALKTVRHARCERALRYPDEGERGREGGREGGGAVRLGVRVSSTSAWVVPQLVRWPFQTAKHTQRTCSRTQPSSESNTFLFRRTGTHPSSESTTLLASWTMTPTAESETARLLVSGWVVSDRLRRANTLAEAADLSMTSASQEPLKYILIKGDPLYSGSAVTRDGRRSL